MLSWLYYYSANVILVYNINADSLKLCFHLASLLLVSVVLSVGLTLVVSHSSSWSLLASAATATDDYPRVLLPYNVRWPHPGTDTNVNVTLLGLPEAGANGIPIFTDNNRKI